METGKSVAAILTLAVLARAPFGQTLPEMETLWESLDGMQEDTEGPVDARTLPQDLRVWLAQGRRRASINVATRDRDFQNEAKDFDSRLLAVELDEESASAKRLLTLTDWNRRPDAAGFVTVADPVLRLDDVSTPATPLKLNELSFSGEVVKDIHIIDAAADLALLVSTKRLRVINYSTDALVVDACIDLPQTPIQGACGTFQAMRSAAIHRIHDGTEWHTLAFVETVMSHPNLTKPQAAGILVCDLFSDPPTFFTDVAHTYDPVTTCPPPPGVGATWSIYDIELVEDGGQHLLYAAGGENVQLRVLDVTSFFSSGFTDTGQSLSPPPPGRIYSVSAERNLPISPPGPDYLYLAGQAGFYAANRSTLSSVLTQTEAGNQPPERDVLLAVEGNDERKLWTVYRERVDYKWKIADVTQVTPPDPPVVEERYYAHGGTDGAVAVLGWDAVYTPNFSGVVRWDISGPDPVPVRDSYEPAAVGGIGYPPEHLELANFGTPAAPDLYLITGAAIGNLIAWRLDPATHDPDPAQLFQAPASGYWPASWNLANHTLYGKDIATWTDPMTGDHYVLFDWFNETLGELAMARFNWTAGTWVSPAIQLPAVPDTDFGPPVEDITVDGGFAFVAAGGGFFVVNLVTGIVDDSVKIDLGSPVCGYGYDVAMGIARYQDRLFVSMNDEPRGGNRIAIAMYSFDVDPVTGAGDASDAPLSCLFDGHDASAPDDFPGLYLVGGGRIHLVDAPDVVRIYACTTTGTLLELAYEPVSDALSVLSHWNNDQYFQELMDCQVYPVGEPIGGFAPFGGPPDMDAWVLVAKWQEAFAIVSPTDLP